MLGVALMWPFADALTRWHGERFRGREDDIGAAGHLDDNVLAVPALAVAALEREVARIGQLASGMAREALRGAGAPALETQRLALARPSTAS